MRWMMITIISSMGMVGMTKCIQIWIWNEN